MFTMRDRCAHLSSLVTMALTLAVGSAVFAAPAAGKADRNEIVAAAKKIDSLVAAGYEKAKAKPQPLVSDYVFLRRAYLDIAGRNPTLAETKAFLASKDRKKLVDQLLDSEGYVHAMFNYWADLMRVKSTLAPQAPGANYIDYIKTSIRENKPYDKFVYDMLAAEGRLMDNGAVGYLIRDTGMPLDNLAVTVRIFLGTSIGCAQCHDHPFDKWTQLEFYELSAYTYGVEYRDNSAMKGIDQRQLFAKLKADGVAPNVNQTIRNILNANAVGLSDTKRDIKLPDDYKYDDAKPGQVIKPMTIFGSEAKVEDSKTPREAFAKWVTSRDNPRFALAIANRMWKRVMGMGLYEPVDEITDKSKPSNPELMEFLKGHMLALNFSVKDYLRTLYYTDTYQRGALPADLGQQDAFVFQGRMVKRLSAEQMWDCMVTLAAAEPDSLTRGQGGYYYGGNFFDSSGKSTDDIVAIAKQMTGGGKGKNMMMMNANGSDKGAKLSPLGAGVIRSAALDSPAPPGHFLRQFGQSDREQVDASTTAPNISQVLDLLNGEIDSIVLNPQSELVKTLAKTPNPVDKIQSIFVAVLCRPATQPEVAIAMAHINRSTKETIGGANGIPKGYGDLVWSLLNTREFMFVQ
jgi:hypothetical protein